jgi:uncharacterized protein
MGQQGYLKSRVLKISVGFLLNDAVSSTHDSELDFPPVQVDEDLIVDFIKGALRLSRTKEGILVQANLAVGVTGDCYRCLDPISSILNLELEELFSTTDKLSSDQAEFRIYDDAQLDLAPLIRAEVLLQTTRGLRCEDVDGCNERMQILRQQAEMDDIDPRLAALRQLLNKNDAQERDG